MAKKLTNYHRTYIFNFLHIPTQRLCWGSLCKIAPVDSGARKLQSHFHWLTLQDDKLCEISNQIRDSSHHHHTSTSHGQWLHSLRPLVVFGCKIFITYVRHTCWLLLLPGIYEYHCSISMQDYSVSESLLE